MSDEVGEPGPAEPPGPVPGTVGEHRWPAALGVTAALVIPLFIQVGYAGWLRGALFLAGLVLLVAIIASDPGRIDEHRRTNRRLSVGLLIVLVVLAASSTLRLVLELLEGAPALSSADTLLAAGALIWLEDSLVFSLVFWELDGGGPAARFHRVRSNPDFAFPQQMDPELAPPHWRPEYHDYLYLSLTNALAFSPTDAIIRPSCRIRAGS